MWQGLPGCSTVAELFGQLTLEIPRRKFNVLEDSSEGGAGNFLGPIDTQS
jgi:hypothetical protein